MASNYRASLSDALPHLLHFPNTTTFMIHKEEGCSFDFGELEEAIVLNNHQIQTKQQALYRSGETEVSTTTLKMFPFSPIKYQQTTPRIGSSKSGEQESTDSASASAVNTFETTQPESPISIKPHLFPPHEMEMMPSGSNSQRTGNNSSQSSKQHTDKRRGPGSSSEKVLDAKTLRRLAQNREAARKSRLRKKAYVQQLESSRIRLTQLEQDLHRARSQGVFLGGGGVSSGNVSSGGAIFDMEYARWLDDDVRHMSELRTALQAHLPDSDLRIVVDGCVAHHDELFSLKSLAAKSDVFHLITGVWTTPAERCFLWMGGFRPSELIKMLMSQLDPLTEQQVVGIYGLQQSSQQAEEALSQGLEQLQQSLVDTVANGSIIESMHHMAIALSKLANLEGFVRQADNLRQQTLHQLRRILTVRQAARCFLVIGEYYARLRALSSLWASRPRETMDDNSCQTTTDLQMMQSSHHNNQFSNF